MDLKDKIKSIARYEYMYFMRYPNVVGVGCGNKYINDVDTGKLSIQVYVEKKWPKGYNLSGSIPKYYYGIPTDVIETGKFIVGGNFDNKENFNGKANDESQGIIPVDKQNGLGINIKVRPVKMGNSIRAYYPDYPAAGAAGCIVTRKDSGPEGDFLKFYILSSNVVIAWLNRIPINTKIAQPAFGAGPDDAIAVLSEFVPIQFVSPGSTPINYVDAAIAEIIDLNLVTPEIEFIGMPKGIDTNPQLDDLIRMCGPSAGYTAGRLFSESVTFIVTYANIHEEVYFVDQILTRRIATGLDGGAVAVNKNNEIIGMVIIGGGNYTMISKIANIQKLLNVSVYTQE